MLSGRRTAPLPGQQEGAPPTNEASVSRASSKFDQLERKEGELWRVSLLVVVLLATALAVNSWEALQTLPQRTFKELSALPLSVLILMVLFAAYVWQKKRELAELKAFLRGMRENREAPPTEQQLEQLLHVLGRSQQGYRDLIDSFEDLVFTVDLDGEVRAVNRSFRDMVGVPYQEIVGRRLDEFLEEPSRALADKALPRFLERRHWAGVIRVKLRPSGEVRYLDCVLRGVVRDDRVVGISCLARDVTQQREAEARFTELFETLQEGIYFTTPDGKFLDANPALVRMLGYDSKEELLEVNVRELYADPASRTEFLERLEIAGTLREQEIVLRRKDGSPLICLDTASAIRDPMGVVVRCQGTLVDITERRQMEKRLYEEQEFARRLVDSFPDLIVVLDTDLRYRFVSARITELLGYAPEELVGRVAGERSHPDDQAAMVDLCQQLVSGKDNFGTVEYRTQHKDGSWRLFRATVSPLYDEAGGITGLVASSRDFTEFKRLEQQVIQSEKLAAMGQLIAGVAHELNNPLTAILGISDLLRERAPDSTARRQLDLVNEQARRAADIVQNLLAFSRPAAAQKILLNLNDIVQRTLQLHEYSLRVNNITVDFTPQRNLPLVLGDPNQLMQLFLNLIVNAEQAIREVRDHGTLRVRLGKGASGEGAADAAAESLWVTFQDDGSGIPTDVLPRIFDPFFTTKRPGRGTGLGLSICLALIREHGGSIEAQPIEGGGTVFKVSLPLVATPAEAQGASSDRAVSRETAAEKLRGRSILVVDDEESIRELLHTGLTARGASVDCASSGEEALGRIAEQLYHIILCDVKMPGLGGEQVFRRLQTQGFGKSGGAEFIFMTGDVVDPSTVRFLEESGARCVEKPFRVSDLATVLCEKLSKV